MHETHEQFLLNVSVPNSCPVQMFKLYLNKLHPDTQYLWQRPREGRINYIDTNWYEKRPVGKDMLERFMKINLSKYVNLDATYTNHSIRSTVITTLDRDGFEARHIIQLSSHKSESTVKEYAPKCTDSKRKEMFNSLSNAILPPAKKIAVTSAKTTNDNNDDKTDFNIQNVNENLPNFDLSPIDTDTIDDNMLVKILNDFENPNTNNNNSNNNNSTIDRNVTQNTVPQSNQQFNTQVINQNMPVNMPIPRMPTMYFPNSTNVTINYNFGK